MGTGLGGPWASGLFKSLHSWPAPWGLKAGHWGQGDEKDKVTGLWGTRGRGRGRNIYPDSCASPGAGSLPSLAQGGRVVMESAENTCKLPVHRPTHACGPWAQVENVSQRGVSSGWEIQEVWLDD